ncbi:unnamed protein product [Amoebophrya sp. A120]|nr:unnamed protein product [Amoebophrya sp. A120]|eukprot:GSA120T00003785001.1
MHIASRLRDSDTEDDEAQGIDEEALAGLMEDDYAAYLSGFIGQKQGVRRFQPSSAEVVAQSSGEGGGPSASESNSHCFLLDAEGRPLSYYLVNLEADGGRLVGIVRDFLAASTDEQLHDSSAAAGGKRSATTSTSTQNKNDGTTTTVTAITAELRSTLRQVLSEPVPSELLGPDCLYVVDSEDGVTVMRRRETELCWEEVLLQGRGAVGETALHICFLLNQPAFSLLARFIVEDFGRSLCRQPWDPNIHPRCPFTFTSDQLPQETKTSGDAVEEDGHHSSHLPEGGPASSTASVAKTLASRSGTSLQVDLVLAAAAAGAGGGSASGTAVSFAGASSPSASTLSLPPAHQHLRKKMPRTTFVRYVDATYTGNSYRGEACLHIAITNGDLEEVKLLVESGGCDVRWPLTTGSFFRGRLYYGGRPLLFAAAHGHVDILDFLVDHFLKDKEHLHEVAEPQHDLQEDENAPPRPDVVSKTKTTAENHGKIKILARRRRRRIEFLRQTDQYGNTILHLITLHGQVHLLRHVMQRYGPDLDLFQLNHAGFAPISLAAAIQNTDVFSALMDLSGETLWAYGPVRCIRYPLLKLDSLLTKQLRESRVRARLLGGSKASTKITKAAANKVWNKAEVEENKVEEEDSKNATSRTSYEELQQMEDKENEKLHRSFTGISVPGAQRNVLSVLEIIVEGRCHALFTPFVRQLIQDKWAMYGRVLFYVHMSIYFANLVLVVLATENVVPIDVPACGVLVLFWLELGKFRHWLAVRIMPEVSAILPSRPKGGTTTTSQPKVIALPQRRLGLMKRSLQSIKRRVRALSQFLFACAGAMTVEGGFLVLYCFFVLFVYLEVLGGRIAERTSSTSSIAAYYDSRWHYDYAETIDIYNLHTWSPRILLGCASVFGWLHFLHNLRALQGLGPFVIMIKLMVKRDVVRFGAIYLCLSFGYGHLMRVIFQDTIRRDRLAWDHTSEQALSSSSAASSCVNPVSTTSFADSSTTYADYGQLWQSMQFVFRASLVAMDEAAFTPADPSSSSGVTSCAGPTTSTTSTGGINATATTSTLGQAQAASSQQLSGALLQEVRNQPVHPYRGFAVIVYDSFVVLSAVVLFNLLIAMMADTYSRIRATAKDEHLLQRTSWILEAERSTLARLGVLDVAKRPAHHVRTADLLLENGRVIENFAMQVEMTDE